jgi:pyrrolidone-carboxylate peptidase
MFYAYKEVVLICVCIDATFKIPDTSGYCAQRENIVQEMEFDAKLTCKLDVGKLCDELGDAGYQVQVSSDPGRYICNWI